jgi:hypothetical protein
MAFFDEYQDLGGGGWMKADEKQVLMEQGIPFQVIDVVDDPTNTYEGAPSPRYVVVALVPNPEDGTEEERKLGFPKGTVESRDRMLVQLAEYLQREDAEQVIVKLEKVGRSHVLRQAD